MAGSEPKRSLEDWSGLGSPRPVVRTGGSFNPITWVKNGRMPSLWVLARLQLGLAIVSIVAGFVAGSVGAMFTLGVFSTTGVFSAFQMIVGALTFSVSAAIMLLGAAVTGYLAARNDREASALIHPPRLPGTEPRP